MNEIKEWILTISAAVSMISVGVGIIVAGLQYRLKLKEEERLAFSSRAEVDVRLVKAFTELMDIAMARRHTASSEKVVEELFKLGVINKEDFNEDFDNLQTGSTKLSQYSAIILPVGQAVQRAAIAAIASLAKTYPVLRGPAIEGLENIARSNIGRSGARAEEYLRQIKSEERAPETAGISGAPPESNGP